MSEPLSVEDAIAEIDGSEVGASRAWGIVRQHIEDLASSGTAPIDRNAKFREEERKNNEEAMTAALERWHETGIKVVNALRLPPQDATVNVREEQISVLKDLRSLLGEDRLL